MPARHHMFLVPLVAVALLAACDATTPEGSISRITGIAAEADAVPAPPLDVEVRTWTTGSDAAFSVWLQTDLSGGYAVDLESLAPSAPDSVRVDVTRFDCEAAQSASITISKAELPNTGTVVVPALAIGYRLALAQVGTGASFCAAVVTRNAVGLIEDEAALAIWIDDISDSVRGRWRVNHSASIGDDYGYFSGSEVDAGGTHALHLHLRPTQSTTCAGLDLVIPTVSPNSATVDVSTVTGDGTCSLPSGPVRFFEGATLQEIQPPLPT